MLRIKVVLQIIWNYLFKIPAVYVTQNSVRSQQKVNKGCLKLFLILFDSLHPLYLLRIQALSWHMIAKVETTHTAHIAGHTF